MGSPLEQATQPVNPVTNPMGALQAMAAPGARRPEDAYLQDIRTRYKETMDRLTSLATNPAGSDEASMWGAIAGGMGSVSPQYGNFGQMLAAAGAAYGKQQATAEQQRFERNAVIAKLYEQDVRKQLGAQQGKFIQFKDDKGNLYIMNNATGERQVIPASGVKSWDALYNKFLANRLANNDPDAVDNATAMAREAMASSPRGVADTATVQPPVKPVGAPSAENTAQATGMSYPKVKPEEDAAYIADQIDLLRRERLKYAGNADVQRDLDKQESTLRKKLSAYEGGFTPGPVQATGSYPATKKIAYLDKPKEKMEEAAAGEVGKDLGKELTNLNQAAATSAQVTNQLIQLKQLYENPNIPEGTYGPAIQSIRSGLKGLGADIKDVGDADLADKIAKNYSLHLRTAGGQNLLPGAMSNYEDQLLQSMGPSLSSTQAGRLAQIELMLEIDKTNQRLASEINKMAGANRGIPPSEWHQRRERIIKEEKARLAVVSRGIIERLRQGEQ